MNWVWYKMARIGFKPMFERLKVNGYQLKKIEAFMELEQNSVIHKLAVDQAQQVSEQIKENSPEPLVKTGDVTEINEITPIGYLIDKPGKYVLGQSIEWTPLKEIPFATAIVITCSDVVLDFQGHSIKATNNNDGNTTIGVSVFGLIDPCKNVTIKNGTIENMGLSGLSSYNTVELTISDMTVEGLNYSDFKHTPSGFSLVDAKSFTIDNCQVRSVTAKAKLAAGFMVALGKNGSKISTVSNCKVSDFTNNDGVACGYSYTLCSGINTVGCSVSGLTTLYGGDKSSTIGHTCIGFMPAECLALNFADCSAENIHGCCDDCHGMSLFPVYGASVTNFTASHVHDGLGSKKTGAKATGLEVYGKYVNIVDCKANDITAIVPQDLQSTGFSACGTYITFDGCTANNVQVLNADKQPDTSHGYGTGFGWAPDPRPQYAHPSKMITYKNCTANDCQLGFDTWNHLESKWDNPKTTGDGLTHLIEPAGTKRVYSMNFCSELPGSTPDSQPKNFPIFNEIGLNKYPSDWE